MLAVAQSLAMLFAARVSTGVVRKHHHAGLHRGRHRAEDRAKASGFLGAAFGLGFIVGPGLAGLFAHISYTAPIWAAAAVTIVAAAMAWLWLPETVHRGSAVAVSPLRALPEVLVRAHLRPLLIADFTYWCSFAVCTTTFALFASRRFGFDVVRTGTARRLRPPRRHRAGPASLVSWYARLACAEPLSRGCHSRSGVGACCCREYGTDVSAFADSAGIRRRLCQRGHRDAS